MVDLLTWSYAPMPSTERTVRVGSVGPASVANCKLWTLQGFGAGPG